MAPTNERGLSLDLSRKATGVVHWLDGHPVATEIIALPKGDIGLQLHEFDRILQGLLERQLTWLAYEDAFTAGHHHALIQHGMVGLIEMRAHRRQLLTLGVNSSTMKKRLAGNGRATKPDMVAAAQKLHPELEIESHDVADALAAGLVLLDRLEPVEP